MKLTIKSILLVLSVAFYMQGYAQKPEPVYSVVRQVHDFDWYETQAKAWKQEIDNGSTNAMAWVYWSEANRMAHYFCDASKWESKKGDYFVPNAQLVEAAEKAIPNSFEYYFLKMQAERNNKAISEDYLMKAQALRPYDDLLLPWLMNQSVVANDKVGMAQVSTKWFESNEMPQELYATAYNNLISLDTNAILLTDGDNDSYPAWILQAARKVRPDVLILNISMSRRIDSYREKVFAENGIKPLVFANDSVRTDQNLFKHLITNVAGRPIYVSVFTSEDVYKAYVKNMYFIGLSLKYSPKPFDNLAVLRNNVENKYMLDFLKQSFQNNPSQSVINMVNGGYLASFQKLYTYYKQIGQRDKAIKIKALAVTVAKNSGLTDWLKYFEK